MLQLPHVTGQAAEIPTIAHRFFVSLFAAHVQNREILLPSDDNIFSRNVESAQGVTSVGAIDGRVDNVAEGDGEGFLID